MKPRLIIVRGNSGSGKSTIARLLREKLGDTSMLVQQDVVRREMLHVKDRPGNPAIELIHNIVLYGKTIGYTVILEGILRKDMYGESLAQLIEAFEDETYIYYMDVSFEETVRRHHTKPNKDEYGVEKLKEWWTGTDTLGVTNEQIIQEDMSLDSAIKKILNDQKNHNPSS